MNQIPADNGGLRYNDGKMARYDLIPPEALEALAIHYGQGAKKYADRNWERGMHWNKSYASLMRHVSAWFRGESYDKEDPKMPGYRAHHMIAAAWNAFTAYTYEARKVGVDDRPLSNTTVGGKIGVAWSNPADVTNGAATPPPTLSAATEERITEHGRVGGRLPTEPRNTLEPGWLVEGNKATPLARTTLPRQTQPFTFWYLATPYSKYPGGHESAALLAASMAAQVMEARVPVFSPIAHSHPISRYVKTVSNTDHDFWINADAPFINLASGLIVVTMEGWEESKGMAEEIKRFTAAGKPVVYWAPWCRIPTTILDTAR